MTTASPSDQDRIRQLERAVEELSILNDLARAISLSRDYETIYQTIVKRSMKAVKAEQASISLIDDDDSFSHRTVAYNVRDGGEKHFHLNQRLKGMMSVEGRARVFNDVHGDETFRGIELDPAMRNLACVPLQVGAKVIGALSAYNKAGGRDFSEADLRILAIMASQSAQVLENARRQQELEKNRTLIQEMEFAEAIQEALLPHGPPEVPGYDIHGISVPAGHVGGDSFDFIPLDDQRWAVSLGDVSGKGLPAALLMSNLQATLRSLSTFLPSCHQCVAACNRLLFRTTTPDKFATLAYTLLDTRSHALTYCNAGHEQPILIGADGRVRRLDRGGLPVGITEDAKYGDDVVIMQPGDLVVIFSDGVVDMENPGEEHYGEKRLLALVEANRNLSARDLVELIRDQVAKHAAGAPPFDDVTVVYGHVHQIQYNKIGNINFHSVMATAWQRPGRFSSTGWTRPRAFRGTMAHFTSQTTTKSLLFLMNLAQTRPRASPPR